jgi:glycosyltransferase involved in cell wall biosynthesis
MSERALEATRPVATIGPVDSLYRRSYSLVHRARDFARERAWTPNWSRVEENPARPEPIGEVPLFAIVGSYNEADVIEASVKNALTQGAERVYLVDNASTDDTVERAVSAGAILAERYETECVEDRLRTMLMNAVVWHVSSAERAPHIWWLWMDADEFSHGPGNQTIAQYLSGLDRRFRTVGSSFFQHFPHTRPEYVPGFHPLEFQPMCEPFWQDFMPRCPIRHYKHPLARFDRSGPFLLAPNSFHSWMPNDKSQLVEPRRGIVTHHVQYRQEETTRRRLASVYSTRSPRAAQIESTGSDGGRRRLRSLDAVYAQRWSEVDNDRHVRGDVGVRLQRWSDLSPGFEVARWYSSHDLARARAGAGTGAGAGTDGRSEPAAASAPVSPDDRGFDA